MPGGAMAEWIRLVVDQKNNSSVQRQNGPSKDTTGADVCDPAAPRGVSIPVMERTEITSGFQQKMKQNGAEIALRIRSWDAVKLLSAAISLSKNCEPLRQRVTLLSDTFGWKVCGALRVTAGLKVRQSNNDILRCNLLKQTENLDNRDKEFRNRSTVPFSTWAPPYGYWSHWGLLLY